MQSKSVANHMIMEKASIALLRDTLKLKWNKLAIKG